MSKAYIPSGNGTVVLPYAKQLAPLVLVFRLLTRDKASHRLSLSVKLISSTTRCCRLIHRQSQTLSVWLCCCVLKNHQKLHLSVRELFKPQQKL